MRGRRLIKSVTLARAFGRFHGGTVSGEKAACNCGSWVSASVLFPAPPLESQYLRVRLVEPFFKLLAHRAALPNELRGRVRVVGRPKQPRQVRDGLFELRGAPGIATGLPPAMVGSVDLVRSRIAGWACFLDSPRIVKIVASLEIMCTRKGTEGSNPSLSAELGPLFASSGGPWGNRSSEIASSRGERGPIPSSAHVRAARL